MNHDDTPRGQCRAVLMIVLSPAREVVLVEAFASLAESRDYGGVGKAVIEHEVNLLPNGWLKIADFAAAAG